MRTFRYDRRPAFTLVELLVVIAIIGVLAGLAIYFVPSFRTSARAARGAADLQGVLNAARQRAIRDQAPRGVRILFDNTTGLAVQCQYLEQPDDLGSGKYWDSKNSKWLSLQLHPSPDGMPNKILIKDLNNVPAFNFGPGFTADPTVQIGDYIELDGGGLPHYIKDSAPSDPKAKPGVYDMLFLYSDLPEAISTAVTNFRIARKPRVVGDEVFDMPKSIVVDGNTNNDYAASVPGIEKLPVDGLGNLDIMFSPSGAVMARDFSKPHIVLWVRSTDEDDQYPTAPGKYLVGEPTLIVVYMNTGLVAAYPVNTGNPANPYDLVK